MTGPHLPPGRAPAPTPALLGLACLALAFACPGHAVGRGDDPARPDPAGTEFFETEVRPLLVEKCQSCHGGKKTGGGLSLTRRAGMLAGGVAGRAAVPGKPAESLLIKAVHQTGALKMPLKGKFRAKEVAKRTLWVAAGAVWPAPGDAPGAGGRYAVAEKQRHWWAFQPVRVVAVPSVADRDWPRSDLDRFVLAELERRSIAPAKPAERRALLRRVTFDLTGLPPTPEEVEAVLRDDCPVPFGKVVDRLLASPAYGQPWARPWLDVVRYADYHDGNPKARNPGVRAASRRGGTATGSCRASTGPAVRPVHRPPDRRRPAPAPDGREPYADGLVATTFPGERGVGPRRRDKEKMVSDMVDDQIDTVGKAFWAHARLRPAVTTTSSTRSRSPTTTPWPASSTARGC